MRILPLGGAHEVGASSTIVEIDSKRVLVDAGIRIGAGSGHNLPDLSRIQEEAGPIDAIFLTHAHIDHSGALPLVHMAYPEAPIYMTQATFAVVRILFADSMRLMEGKYKDEGEIPLYPPAAVESCMGCIRPVPYEYSVTLPGQGMSATFHPAGHILGASAITFRGRSGSIMITGDISVTDQRTVPGMHAPQLRPDVVMIESTYGDRLHAHRPTQEAQLVRKVAETIESGGKVIIPAFAVGRAQEVILILRQAIIQKQITPFPIYVDGMVKAVCDAYSRFPTYLQRHLRHSVQRGEHPFFPAGGHVHRVRSNAQRRKLLDGPPCCIVASSGMMTGGPSAYYAAALADNTKNLIAITGYQDEEAPGRHLLELADTVPTQRRLWLNDREVAVRCKVEKYALSAHADSGEISGLLGHMDPSQGVVLVHGDGGAREALASMLDGQVKGRVYTPQNGEVMQFRPGRKVFYPAPNKTYSRIGAPGQELNKHTLSHLYQALWAENGRRSLFRLPDLFARWYGPNYTPSVEELDTLKALLSEEQSFFDVDRRRSHLYRLRPPAKHGKQRRHQVSNGVMEMNQAMQQVAVHFSDESGLYKKGARHEERKLLLFFHFPQTARRKFKKELAQLAEETGWSVELNKMPHHAALEEHARRSLPEGWTLARNPAIRHEEQTVRLSLYHPESEVDVEGLSAGMKIDYLTQTGYSLQIKTKPLEEVVTASQEMALSEEVEPAEKLEINLAYQKIEEHFATKPHRPYKKSKKGDRIVLSFLSPVIGQRYAQELEQLSRRLGWPLSFNPEPNQYGIKQEVRTLIPENWILKKDPAIFKKQQVVRLRLEQEPEQELLSEIAERVYERTGFHIEIAEP